MDTSLKKELIEACIQPKVWDLGNKVLYDLCATHFTHDNDEKILAKVWLIGRSYAVALERRKNKKDINDNFYINEVAPAFRNSKIDERLAAISKNNIINRDTLKAALEIHNYLTIKLHELTELEKRSFSSKYLHFHLPDLFYIYDSRAVNALRRFIKRVPIELKALANSNSVDKEYAKFACKCFQLQHIIQHEFDIQLSTRQLDNFLVEVANDRLKAKNIAKIKAVANSSLLQ